MRSVELVCSCGAYMGMEDKHSNMAILSLAHRFANAHVRCGYVTPGHPDDAVVSQETREIP